MFKQTLSFGVVVAASLACAHWRQRRWRWCKTVSDVGNHQSRRSKSSKRLMVWQSRFHQHCTLWSVLAKSKPLSSSIINAAYAYQFGPVAFKTTLAYEDTTFCTTKDGALSYFIGDDPNYNDPGFGIGSEGDGNYPNLSNRSPWVKCTPEIYAIQVFGNTANAMGWVHFEAEDGTTSKVDKTFSYVRDDDGNLRITVHHSSSPYSW